MKQRSIEEVHDKEVGHPGFARFVDSIIEDGHTISDIKEYNEKFVFELDGNTMMFSKLPGANWKAQKQNCYSLLDLLKKLA